MASDVTQVVMRAVEQADSSTEKGVYLGSLAGAALGSVAARAIDAVGSSIGLVEENRVSTLSKVTVIGSTLGGVAAGASIGAVHDIYSAIRSRL